MFVVSQVRFYNIRTCIGSFLLFFSQRFFYLIIHFVVVVSPWKHSMVLFYLQAKRREKKVRGRTTHTIIRWWHFRVIRRWCQYCRGLDLWVHYIQITRARMRHMCSFICTKRTYFIVFHLWGFLRYHIYNTHTRSHILRSIHSDNMFGALKFNYKQRLWVRYATNVRQRNMVMYFTMDSNAASNGINGTHKWWWQCVRSCSIVAWFDMNVLCFVTQANF